MKRERFNEQWRVSSKQGNFGVATVVDEKTVTLPYDAMIHTKRKPNVVGTNKKGFFENGTWEYKKTFAAPADWKDRKVMLEFGGVYQRAMVYVNGDLAGQRPYGYVPFTVELDKYLRYGEDNNITVAVRTADDARWYTGAGIYRDVNLLTAAKVYIQPQGVRVTTPDIDAQRAVVCVATTLQNDSGEEKITCKVVTEVLSAEGEVVATDTAPCTVFRGESAVLRQRVFVKGPKLWNVDTPNLYTCKTTVYAPDETVLDENMERFGIRGLSLDFDNGLRINGEMVKLRGTCLHHDHGPIGAAAIYGAEERRIKLLKEAGFNAIRMSHHPVGTAILRACDELGMLVMDEAFDMWTTSKSDFDYSIDFSTWWEKDVEAMVAQDFNHPSVIMYSIGNEIQDTGSPVGTAWGRKIAEKVRALDPTRYTLNSINGMVAVMELLMKMQADMMAQMQQEQPEEQPQQQAVGEINNMMSSAGEQMRQMMCMEAITHATAESFACVDIAGYNYMDTRYLMDRQLFPNRIVCGSETFPPDIDRNWRLVLDNGNVLGDFTWTGWDYLGEAGIGKIKYPDDGNVENVYGEYPALTAMVGDIDITGYRRPVSYYREIVFGQRTAPYIAVQRPEHYHDIAVPSMWSFTDAVSSWSWDGFEGKPVKVEVYSPAQEVELLINGKSVGRQPVGEANRFRAIFDATYEPGEIVAVAYTDGEKTGRTVLQSAKGEVKISAVAECDRINAVDGLAYVNIALTDDAGNVFVNQARKIKVTATGAGQLEGFGTGDPDSEENFYDDERTTFDGHALAVIRPTGVGEIIVTVSAEGMAPRTLKIVAEG